MISLGRLEANMARRLIKRGHQCVTFDMRSQAIPTSATVYAVPPRSRPAACTMSMLAVALAARFKCPGKGFISGQHELYLCEDALSEGSIYERLLGDAMAADGGPTRVIGKTDRLFAPLWAAPNRVMGKSSE